MRGLKELADAMDDVQKALLNCKAPEERIVKLADAIAMIRHPVEFAYMIGRHFIVDRVEIFDELNDAGNDWKHHSYEHFGFELGLICSQILIGGVRPPTPQMFIA